MQLVVGMKVRIKKGTKYDNENFQGVREVTKHPSLNIPVIFGDYGGGMGWLDEFNWDLSQHIDVVSTDFFIGGDNE